MADSSWLGMGRAAGPDRRPRPTGAAVWRGVTALALMVWLAPPASAAATFSGPTNFGAGDAPHAPC